jgi:Ser/Thr protein kinase RdoA (MazF antagonist)
MDEEQLAGGNTTPIVRLGDTVRREAGPWTPAVRRLLDALRAAGIEEVPEHRGFDEQGREILTFLPGHVPSYPLPSWVWSPSVLADSARLLRRLHDASTAILGEGAVWRLSAHEPAEVICHNDFAPYNLVFADGVLTGVIDFDTASPGPRLWDLGYLAYRLVPLGETREGPIRERPERLDALIAAYGMPFTREQLVLAAADRLDELAVFTDGRARDTGRPDFVEHAALYRRDRDRLRGGIVQ